MKTMRVCETHSTKPNEGAHGLSIAFESMCPKCAQVRPQHGFDRNSLLRVLSSGYPVEAYCELCDEFWSISAKERAALVAATISGGGSFVC
jgi:hypothetical protein